MKIKSGELTDAALDWAVAMCKGKDNAWALYCVKRGGLPYSTSWEHGGPIIEREHIGVYRSSGQWIAEWWPDNSGMARNPAQKFQHNRHTCGPTPLVAAMRAYVASKMGDTVDVPDDLV